MTSTQDYAVLSLYVYDVENKDKNRPLLPDGWTELTTYRVDGSGIGITELWSSGFSARVYRHTSSREIVISYGGTKGDPSWGTLADFIAGNVALATGHEAGQANKAAELYQRVVAEVGEDVTFTGPTTRPSPPRWCWTTRTWASCTPARPPK